MPKTIAFFDFDGTITSSDTMLELVKYCKGKPAYYIGMALISPYLISMKLGIVSKTKAKEKMLQYFFGGMQLKDFNDCCSKFSSSQVPSLIRPGALKKIKEHLGNNDEVVVVSASAENWIRDWCNHTGIKYLGTKLQVMDDKITGKLDGPNCNGEEKVNRIKLAFNPADYDKIYCYGDTGGDKQMLQLATDAFYRPFH